MKSKFLKQTIVVALIIVVSVVSLATPAGEVHAATGTSSCSAIDFAKKAAPLILKAVAAAIVFNQARFAIIATAGAIWAPAGLYLEKNLPEAKNFDFIISNIKPLIFDAFARCVARGMFDSTVLALLDAVRTGGRDGGVDFIKNWKNFQLQAAARGEGVFRAVLANTPVCDYLRSEIDSSYRVTAKSKIDISKLGIRVGSADPFTLTGKCTLPQGFDLAKYNQDFAGQGGWAAFQRLLEPQNNPVGLALLAQDEQQKQIAAEQSANDAEIQAGKGFLGLRGGAASCLTRSETGACLVYSDVKTPGIQVADTAAAITNNELRWITDVHTWQDLAVSAVDVLSTRLTSRLLDLGASETPVNYNTGTLPTIGPQSTLPPNVFPPVQGVPTPGGTVPTPTPTTPTPGGAPGCFPNPDAGSAGACSLLCNGGTQGDFTGAIRSATIAIANDGSGTLDPNDAKSDSSFRILNHDAWMNKLVAALGSGARIDTDQEINIKNGGSSEQYLVSTSNGYTASRLRAQGCP